MTRGPYQTVVEFHPFDGLNQCLLLRDDDQSKLLRRDDCRADALCFISPFLFLSFNEVHFNQISTGCDRTMSSS